MLEGIKAKLNLAIYIHCLNKIAIVETIGVMGVVWESKLNKVQVYSWIDFLAVSDPFIPDFHSPNKNVPI